MKSQQQQTIFSNIITGQKLMVQRAGDCLIMTIMQLPITQLYIDGITQVLMLSHDELFKRFKRQYLIIVTQNRYLKVYDFLNLQQLCQIDFYSGYKSTRHQSIHLRIEKDPKGEYLLIKKWTQNPKSIQNKDNKTLPSSQTPQKIKNYILAINKRQYYQNEGNYQEQAKQKMSEQIPNFFKYCMQLPFEHNLSIISTNQQVLQKVKYTQLNMQSRIQSIDGMTVYQLSYLIAHEPPIQQILKQFSQIHNHKWQQNSQWYSIISSYLELSRQFDILSQKQFNIMAREVLARQGQQYLMGNQEDIVEEQIKIKQKQQIQPRHLLYQQNQLKKSSYPQSLIKPQKQAKIQSSQILIKKQPQNEKMLSELSFQICKKFTFYIFNKLQQENIEFAHQQQESAYFNTQFHEYLILYLKDIEYLHEIKWFQQNVNIIQYMKNYYLSDENFTKFIYQHQESSTKYGIDQTYNHSAIQTLDISKKQLLEASPGMQQFDMKTYDKPIFHQNQILKQSYKKPQFQLFSQQSKLNWPIQIKQQKSAYSNPIHSSIGFQKQPHISEGLTSSLDNFSNTQSNQELIKQFEKMIWADSNQQSPLNSIYGDDEKVFTQYLEQITKQIEYQKAYKEIKSKIQKNQISIEQLNIFLQKINLPIEMKQKLKYLHIEHSLTSNRSTKQMIDKMKQQGIPSNILQTMFKYSNSSIGKGFEHINSTTIGDLTKMMKMIQLQRYDNQFKSKNYSQNLSILGLSLADENKSMEQNQQEIMSKQYQRQLQQERHLLSLKIMKMNEQADLEVQKRNLIKQQQYQARLPPLYQDISSDHDSQSQQLMVKQMLMNKKFDSLMKNKLTIESLVGSLQSNNKRLEQLESMIESDLKDGQQGKKKKKKKKKKKAKDPKQPEQQKQISIEQPLNFQNQDILALQNMFKKELLSDQDQIILPNAQNSSKIIQNCQKSQKQQNIVSKKNRKKNKALKKLSEPLPFGKDSQVFDKRTQFCQILRGQLRRNILRYQSQGGEQLPQILIEIQDQQQKLEQNHEQTIQKPDVLLQDQLERLKESILHGHEEKAHQKDKQIPKNIDSQGIQNCISPQKIQQQSISIQKPQKAKNKKKKIYVEKVLITETQELPHQSKPENGPEELNDNKVKLLITDTEIIDVLSKQPALSQNLEENSRFQVVQTPKDEQIVVQKTQIQADVTVLFHTLPFFQKRDQKFDQNTEEQQNDRQDEQLDDIIQQINAPQIQIIDPEMLALEQNKQLILQHFHLQTRELFSPFMNHFQRLESKISSIQVSFNSTLQKLQKFVQTTTSTSTSIQNCVHRYFQQMMSQLVSRVNVGYTSFQQRIKILEQKSTRNRSDLLLNYEQYVRHQITHRLQVFDQGRSMIDDKLKALTQQIKGQDEGKIKIKSGRQRYWLSQQELKRIEEKLRQDKE